MACYIDGALSPEAAVQVTEHLASCESCFEVYSGVLEFQLEAEPAPLGQVVPFPGEKRRQPAVWWYSIAALLVVGVGFGGYSYLLASPAPLVTADLTAKTQVKTGLAENLWRGVVTRGAGDEPEPGNELSPDKAAFRTGVQVVNLQVCLAANDVRNSQDAIAGIYRVLGTQPSTGDLQSSYKELTGAIGEAKAPKNLLPKASQLASESRELLDPLYFDLGQWVEAGRLAAISQDPAFFHLSETQSFLRRVLWRDRLGFRESKLPKGSRGELEATSDILAKRELRSADFDALGRHFEKILTANYPQ